MPKISIVLPNYNHARFLPARIDSILQQTYQDFELIILDDCSTDQSREVIETYRNHQKVSHIIYNEENSGSTFRQWDKGLNLAQGKYVWIAESDDLCEHTLLEELIAAIEKYDGIVAYSRIRYIDQNGNYLDNPTASGQTFCYKSSQFMSQKMTLGNAIYNASCALFSRDIALGIDQEYMSYKAAGDYLFWTKMAENGNVVFIDKMLDYCRTHGANVTTKAQKSGLTYREDFRVFQYMKQRKLLSFKELIKAQIYHIELILTKELESEALRRELLDLWDPSHLLRQSVVRASFWKYIN